MLVLFPSLVGTAGFSMSLIGLPLQSSPLFHRCLISVYRTLAAQCSG